LIRILPVSSFLLSINREVNSFPETETGSGLLSWITAGTPVTIIYPGFDTPLDSEKDVPGML
jgi:hypothetical protein